MGEVLRRSTASVSAEVLVHRSGVERTRGRLLGGRYRLLRPLGSGGMGSVYAARDERVGGEVALKVLRARANPALLERFRREARLTATLGNPHIVRVTDFHENRGEPAFIVMERIEGLSLKKLIEQTGPLPPRRACAIAAQILSALSDAHAAGILHRDVKPANVLIASSPAGDLVKVVDFGLARLDESRVFGDTPTACMQLTAAGELVGTAGFVAPEHLRGDPVDGRADLYAVGATLFQMLSARKPFEGMSLPFWMATAQRHSPRLETALPEPDPALADVVACAMAVLPDHRFATAKDMMDALTPWTTDAPPPVVWTPVPPPPPLPAPPPESECPTLRMARPHPHAAAVNVMRVFCIGLAITLVVILALVTRVRGAHAGHRHARVASTAPP
jgi:eukaryotic-like serine/threonine-protein kinase